MPTEDGPFARFTRNDLPPGRAIVGFLKSDDGYILATNLHRAGGRWSSSGVSNDRFLAQTCRVSRKRLPASPKVRAVDFNLAGFEEWPGLDLFKITRTLRSVGLRRSVKPQVRYRAEAGRLALTRDLDSESYGHSAPGGWIFARPTHCCGGGRPASKSNQSMPGALAMKTIRPLQPRDRHLASRSERRVARPLSRSIRGR